MIEYNTTGAFIVGLMGAAHCFGMCGGLVGAFASQQQTPPRGSSALSAQLSFILSYNLGRIVSYACAGALVGGSAAALGTLFNIDTYLLVLRLVAGIMMIVTGLYLSQIWLGLVRIESLGTWVWGFLKPLSRRIIPIQTKPKAFIAGLIWGWLPCGLVYSTLTWSVAAGSALEGAKIMFAFGLGTLPALISAGIAAKTLATWVQKRAVRLASGLLLMGFGVHTIYIAVTQLT